MFIDEKESESFHKEIRKGFLKAILLVIIHEKPIHGYDIIQLMKERSGGRWTPSPGSVYPALEHLEAKGYIVSEEVDRKKVYTITPKGEQAIGKMNEMRNEMLRDMTAFFGDL
ncbi:MAG TPA: PadR family transcriptional regulator [Methanocella sp.]|nr:PadR family transcriptional regulator [Methanocella sp.]